MKWVVNSPALVRKTEEPSYFLVHSFSDEIIEPFTQAINKAIDLDQVVFPIYIESFGGEVYTLNYLVSQIDRARKQGLKISTICNSYAMSCGADLFCYGDANLRFLGENATLMFHSASLGIEGKIKEVKANADHVDVIGNIFYEKIDKHLKKKKGFMKNLVYRDGGADVFVTAKEAETLGLGVIASPRFTVEVTTNTKVELLP